MRSNIKRVALSLALSFLAGCIVNIPEQEGKRPANADMPADLAKDSTQDLKPDMVKPGAPVRIDAPATFSVSEGTPRDLSELMAFAVDAMNIPDPNVPLTYKAAEGAPFTISSNQTITGAIAGTGKLEISSPGLETITVEVEVIATKMLNLPQAIYLDVNQDRSLEELFRGSAEQADRERLTFSVENPQIAEINGSSIRGLERGESKLTVTLLHLSQEVRVVVRKPIDQLLISPPMLRLLADQVQGSALKQANFEIVSLDEDGQVRESDPDETLCDMETFDMVNDTSWTITANADVQRVSENQYALSFANDVAGFGSLELGCMVEGSPRNALALVEVITDKQVAAGGAHSCATKDNGNGAPLLRCWGSNEFSAMGLRRESETLGALDNVVVDQYSFNSPIWGADAGQHATCVVNVLGGVDCTGALLMRAEEKFYKVELPQGFVAIDVSVGAAHACAVSQDGALYCWGENSFGQLGQGDTMPKLLPPNDGKIFPEPVQVDATRKWARVSAGAQHTCALDVYGQAFCWGENGFGRLGDDTVEARLSPVAVASPNEQLRFVSIAAADTYTCAVERTGSVYCWGQNHQGRLGQPNDPNNTSFSSPQELTAGALMDRFAVDVEASAGSTCALVRKSGEKIQPVCWGENSKGQLGRPATNAQLTPELFQSPPNKHTLDLAMGPEHGCIAIQGEAAPRCWGAQQNNRLGNDQRGFNPYFQTISFPSNIKDSSFQSNHGCVALVNILGAKVQDSNVHCWGLNGLSQANSLTSFTIGNPASAPSIQISDVREIQKPLNGELNQVFTGPSHSCALDGDDYAFCWGGNWAGQANPQTTDTQVIMAGVSQTAKFTQLALGQGFTCGLVKDSTNGVKIACWGAGELGRLGNGMKASCPDADAACGVMDDQGALLDTRIAFSHIAAATATTCAIGKVDTELGIYCWGARVAKDATKVEQANTAVKVWSGTNLNAYALEAGNAHFCALVGDGASPSQLLCWGDNSFGEVAGASAPWVHLPTAVPMINVSDVSSLALGADHTCLLRSSGQLSCWGRNNVSQLAAPAQPFSRLPTASAYTPKLNENSNIPNVTKLLAGVTTTCVQTINTVYCAGDNAYRQLGGNPPNDIAPTPVPVVGF